MNRQRGTPDRRGMGAQSDLIAEPFVPSEAYKAQQRAMVERMIAAGTKLEDVQDLFLLPMEQIAGGGQG